MGRFGFVARLHGVDGVEHGRNPRTLRFGDLGQRVAVEVHRAALVSGIREHLGDRADHAGGFVADDHENAAQSSRLQSRQEAAPALLRFREALGAADGLAVFALVHVDRHHHRYILVGAAPQLRFR